MMQRFLIGGDSHQWGRNVLRRGIGGDFFKLRRSPRVFGESVFDSMVGRRTTLQSSIDKTN
jgi:hypothetical protein